VLKHFFYIFTQTCSLKHGLLKVLLGFKYVVDFQIEPWCRYFGNFRLGNCLGYFSKNRANYYNPLVNMIKHNIPLYLISNAITPCGILQSAVQTNVVAPDKTPF
jgi:hypothetical protein